MSGIDEWKNKKLGIAANLVVWALLIYFVVWIFSDGKYSSTPNKKTSIKSYFMILTCKMNPNALYKDTLYFNNDMSSMKRTSNNKSARDETYSIKKISRTEYKLKGYRTGGLFVLKKENASKLWGLYYEVDYDTDPFRFMSCRQS